MPDGQKVIIIKGKFNGKEAESQAKRTVKNIENTPAEIQLDIDTNGLNKNVGDIKLKIETLVGSLGKLRDELGNNLNFSGVIKSIDDISTKFGSVMSEIEHDGEKIKSLRINIDGLEDIKNSFTEISNFFAKINSSNFDVSSISSINTVLGQIKGNLDGIMDVLGARPTRSSDAVTEEINKVKDSIKELEEAEAKIDKNGLIDKFTFKGRGGDNSRSNSVVRNILNSGGSTLDAYKKELSGVKDDINALIQAGVDLNSIQINAKGGTLQDFVNLMSGVKSGADDGATSIKKIVDALDNLSVNLNYADKDDASNIVGNLSEGIKDAKSLADAIKLISDARNELTSTVEGKSILKDFDEIVKPLMTVQEKIPKLTLQFDTQSFTQQIADAKSELKGLNEELERAQSYESAGMKVGLDKASIEAIKSLKVAEGSTLGIKEEDLEAITTGIQGIVEAIDLLTRSFAEVDQFSDAFKRVADTAKESKDAIDSSTSDVAAPEKLNGSLHDVSENIQQITDSIRTMSEAFGNVNGDQFKPLLAVLKDIQDAIGRVTDALSGTSVNFNILGGSGSSDIALKNADNKYNDYINGQLKRWQKRYSDMINAARNNNPSDLFGENFLEQIGTAAKRNGMVNFDNTFEFVDRYNSKAIDGLSTVEEKVERIVELFNIIKTLSSNYSDGLGGIWDDMYKITSKTPKDSLADIKNTRNKIYREASEESSDQLDNLLEETNAVKSLQSVFEQVGQTIQNSYNGEAFAGLSSQVTNLITSMQRLVEIMEQINAQYNNLGNSVDTSLSSSATDTAKQVETEGENAKSSAQSMQELAEAKQEALKANEALSSSAVTTAKELKSEGEAAKTAKKQIRQNKDDDDENEPGGVSNVDGASLTKAQSRKSIGLYTDLKGYASEIKNLKQLLINADSVESEVIMGQLNEKVELYQQARQMLSEEGLQTEAGESELSAYEKVLEDALAIKQAHADDVSINKENAQIAKEQANAQKEAEKAAKEQLKAKENQAKEEARIQAEYEKQQQDEAEHQKKVAEEQAAYEDEQVKERIRQRQEYAKWWSDALDVQDADRAKTVQQQSDSMWAEQAERDKEALEKATKAAEEYEETQKRINKEQTQEAKSTDRHGLKEYDEIMKQQADAEKAANAQTEAIVKRKQAMTETASMRSQIAENVSMGADFEKAAKDVQNLVEQLKAGDISAKEFKDSVKGIFDKLASSNSDLQDLMKFDFSKISKLDGNGFSDDYNKKITDLKNNLNGCEDIIDKIRNGEILNREEIDKAKKLKEGFEEIQKFANLEKIGKNTAITNMVAKIEQFKNEFSGMDKGYKGWADALLTQLGNDNLTTNEINQIAESFNKLRSEVSETGDTVKSFWDRFKTSASADVVKQLASTYLSMFDMIRYVKQAANVVTQINASQIELRKVSDASDVDLNAYWDQAAESAKKYGSTINDVINSTADWSRWILASFIS